MTCSWGLAVGDRSVKDAERPREAALGRIGLSNFLLLKVQALDFNPLDGVLAANGGVRGLFIRIASEVSSLGDWPQGWIWSHQLLLDLGQVTQSSCREACSTMKQEQGRVAAPWEPAGEEQDNFLGIYLQAGLV